ncbi:MAG TPA: phosphoribosyltransferase family protein [Puia sp.]|jgi:ComF family protein|nr:phosphoribosyltransferase family protein [Puia sp.]
MRLRNPIIKSILHLFFPYSCCGCGTDLLAENILFCIYCQASMPMTRFEFFPSNPIEKIFWGRVNIHAAAAHLYFTKGSAVQHSLHLLKYKSKKEIGIYFGQQMGAALINSCRFSECEIIIPLPLFAAREKKRGYNQATLIAMGLSQQLKIPVVHDAILRIKKTETQTHKSRIQRWKNMESTFEIRNSQKIYGKHILLIDDVITTGASLEACARVLLGVHGARVSIACLAHTVSA